MCVFHPKTPFSHLFLNDDLVKLHFSIPNEMELILFLFHSKFLHLKRVHELDNYWNVCGILVLKITQVLRFSF